MSDESGGYSQQYHYNSYPAYDYRTAPAQIESAGSSEEQGASEVTDLGLIPATEVKPEDAGLLSLRYVDGVPQLVVSGGTVIPTGLTVVDASGNAVAEYTGGPASSTGTQTASRTIGLADPDYAADVTRARR
ncbi:hypothetical protein ACFVT1_39785 [Streptomyces sp. NPDC057963]|uniref:hypothetical protein n=1 Tax=Streptomyces sp. NPDC057963 TaxID=3346290 RepID=UPI0036E0BC01